MSILNKLLICYDKDPKKGATLQDVSVVRTESLASNSDASTHAPTISLNHLSQSPNSPETTSDSMSPVVDIYERMRVLAERRRYDGVHVRRGNKLVLNM
jgi:hypothetical protein